MKVKFICNRLREKTLFPLVNKQCSKSSSTNQLSRSGEVTNSLVACFCARCQWREKFWKSSFTKWPELGMYLPSQVRTQNASRVLQKWTKIIWNLRAITTTNTQTVKDLTEGEKQKNAKSLEVLFAVLLRADHLAKSYHGKCHSLFVKGLKILVFITGKERQKGKAAKVSLWVA